MRLNEREERTAAALGAGFIAVEAIETPLMYRDFTVKGDVAHAALSITGLGLYRAFLNGARIGEDYLTPGFNDYDAYLRYQSYDVTAFLKTGENRLSAIVGNGWYKGRFGMDSRENIWGDKYLLSAVLTITCADGTVQTLATDGSWRAVCSVIGENSIYDGEARDDTAAIGKPVPCQPIKTDYRLMPAFSPAVRQKLTLKPTLLVSPKGERILDFGQNMVGVVRFHSRLKRGEALHLRFGEILQNGCFYRDNLRSAKAEYRYVSDGAEKDVEPYFTFYGFRYALVEGPETLTAEDFTGLVLSSNLVETLRVETDSDLLNRLMQNALWSQRGNFIDLPTDCPQRDERLAWTGDAQVFAGTACYHADCADFYRKYLFDLRQEQTRYMAGNIPMFCPSLKGGAPGGAVWADIATILPWTLYERYGDKVRLEEAYPLMRDYAETLIKGDGGTHIRENEFTFGDWLAQDGATPQSFKGATDDGFISTVYYWYSIHLAALAAEMLGKASDAEKYAGLAADIRAAIQKEYFSATGRLCIDTQTGYVLALHYDLCPDREKTVAAFRKRLDKDLLKLKTGFTGTALLLPTLFDCGECDAAYRMLFSEKCPGWLYAVKLGATTLWERWNSVLPDGSMNPAGMNSLNHYSYGSVCEAIYSRIAGLRCTEAGWKTAEIRPHVNYRLKRISLAFDSPAGNWESAWRIDESGRLYVNVTVPEGAKARIFLPLHPQQEEHEVGEGRYAYSYMPSEDLLHPFSADSRLADLAASEAVMDLLRERMPEIAATVEHGEELAADSLHAVLCRFGGAVDAVTQADQLLRAVTV